MFEAIVIFIVAAAAILLGTKSAGGSTATKKTRPNPTRFDDLIEKYANLNGIRFELLKGIIRDESNFNPRAWNDERKKGDSSDDALGLMQVRAGALTDFNEANGKAYMMRDLYEPEICIMVGSWYVSRFIQRYGEEVGLEMYNVGETGYLKKGVRNAQYVAKIQEFAQSYA